MTHPEVERAEELLRLARLLRDEDRARSDDIVDQAYEALSALIEELVVKPEKCGVRFVVSSIFFLGGVEC